MKLTAAIIFALFLSCHTGNRIAIQPYNGMNENLVDTIAQTLEQAYGRQVDIFPYEALPKSAYINIKSPRYRADTLLVHLKKQTNDSVGYVLGLTSADISTTKYSSRGKIKEPEWKYSDWGVFGLGYRPGPSCVVSTFRIKNANNKLYISRLKKVCIHEVGHNLGLPHCETEGCVMMDAAETIKTIDRVGYDLCEKCLGEIQ